MQALQIIGLLCLVGWLGFLSYITFRMTKHYRSITNRVEGKTLQQLLEVLLVDVRQSQKQVKELTKRLEAVEADGKFHIQKIGLRRFNPFNDTGGDQSFILALIDETNTGVVISGLYSRAGTRWYAKRVVKGKGAEHDLSTEEKKAIDLAKKS